MANYVEASVKLTNSILSKFKSSAIDKTGTTLRITQKNFQDEKLFLTTRQKTKEKNDFTSNMSMDIKFRKAQLSKIIQSDGFLANMIDNLGNLGKRVGKEALTNLVIPLAKDDLAGLVSNIAKNAASNVINKFQKKNKNGKGAVGTGKESILFISNEDMDDIRR